jgi:hypothetical protein
MVHITFTPVRRKDGVIQYFAAIEREFQEEEIDRLGRENIERALQEELAELVKELQRDID